ncbi:conserved hypothetical protein [Hydrogenobaculum sp. Y04AAS1]|uniref:hypothetical protein n=1 Tax=Hydrogenobaculum sp. (strain Y04AAS1) TaxID=380749 RepID=UPI00015BC8C1|nr:conserved hypothetical protein [Hydrogenobaculum sp. Y04AAS1]HCT66534.1 hypothetical protein [Hydrogenobaculum sp.]
MIGKRFIVWFFVLFILEFFFLEGNGLYPFPEAFLSLIFLNLENGYIPLWSFLMGILMDLSVNTLGVFTFSYTFYSVIIRLLLSYTLETGFLKLPMFFIFDLLVKLTNVGIVYMKYHYIDFGFLSFFMSIFIDCIIFFVLDRFYKNV